MRILYRGEIEEEKIHKITCRKCKSEMEFKKSDPEVKTVRGDQRDGTFWQFNCPVCGSLINHYK